ncbi:hypothetical protein Mlute_00441 [Meiothermus luteus]|jgi:hypothetical protein|uniref:Uncharacterized protein n=1 Tax=Meiothermus luteus TaxID=2026184 RepID=A0A399F2G4_9DEIN|nr:hypothetical protein [Meiothermus luteus]RIH89032.1 hypothetical protein Mlute_00441 [Meiothermus luteus]RMH58275.1 MAG: hypothetical protein D6684_01310 [Deinococcota bacterium]
MRRRAFLGLLLAGILVTGGGGKAPDGPPRAYSATAQVVALRPLEGGGCWVRVRLHQWVSLSQGFALGEIPQRGRFYVLWASSEGCVALQVAQAEAAGHIYYQAREAPRGGWRMSGVPAVPLGCAGP